MGSEMCIRDRRELDLTVPEGCLYGLLGPNGAGKTTAMRILATLLSPDSGSVVVGGVDGLVQPREVRQLMGLCGPGGGHRQDPEWPGTAAFAR